MVSGEDIGHIRSLTDDEVSPTSQILNGLSLGCEEYGEKKNAAEWLLGTRCRRGTPRASPRCASSPLNPNRSLQPPSPQSPLIKTPPADPRTYTSPPEQRFRSLCTGSNKVTPETGFRTLANAHTRMVEASAALPFGGYRRSSKTPVPVDVEPSIFMFEGAS